jgi:hypothetical protein
MPLDIKDLILEAQAEVTEIVQELMQELVEPQMRTAMRLRWDTVPVDAKELLKKQNPKVYRQLLQMLEE